MGFANVTILNPNREYALRKPPLFSLSSFLSVTVSLSLSFSLMVRTESLVFSTPLFPAHPRGTGALSSLISCHSSLSPVSSSLRVQPPHSFLLLLLFLPPSQRRVSFLFYRGREKFVDLATRRLETPRIYTHRMEV